jgi:hypothetical protein
MIDRLDVRNRDAGVPLERILVATPVGPLAGLVCRRSSHD